MVGLSLRAPIEQKSPPTTLFSQYVPYMLTDNYSITMYTTRAAIGFQMKNGTRPTHMAARFRCPGSQRSSHVNSLKVTRFLFYTQSSKISYIFTNKQTTIKIHTL